MCSLSVPTLLSESGASLRLTSHCRHHLQDKRRELTTRLRVLRISMVRLPIETPERVSAGLYRGRNTLVDHPASAYRLSTPCKLDSPAPIGSEPINM